jgi:nicotinamidase/pyrazinamidase
MKALIAVDIQNDFIKGGALAVPGGEEVVPVVNALMQRFETTIATQDWHPQDHGSFASEPELIGTMGKLAGLDQVLWPVHCVQDTQGAEFVPGLDTEKFDTVIRKGTDSEIDSYSGFFDNAKRKETGLDALLKEKGVDELYITGLATDYCVKFTVLDALELGYRTFVIPQACRGVNLNPDDAENALKEMQEKGAVIIDPDELEV